MEATIIAKLEAGSFEEAVKMIEALDLISSKGSRSTMGIEWYGKDGSAAFKVYYGKGNPRLVEVVGSGKLYSC